MKLFSVDVGIEQVDEHDNPAGEEVTVPEPEPAMMIVVVAKLPPPPLSGAKVAVQVVPALIAMKAVVAPA